LRVQVAALTAAVSRFAYAENLQPVRVFLGSVPHNVRLFDISLRSIALGEIYYASALRAEDVQPQAQCLPLSNIVHSVFHKGAVRRARRGKRVNPLV
jgi:hypothetical protein